jgi:hypothetical protein
MHDVEKYLHITNHKRMEGEEFYDGRFVCTTTVETDTNYRFQFCDHNWPSLRYIWVEVSRFGEWDSKDSRWVYRLNYPQSPTHIVSAQFLSDFHNAIKTMGTALKYSIDK